MRSAMRILLLAVGIFALGGAAAARFIDGATGGELEAILGVVPCLLVFHVGWCVHCKEMMPEVRVLGKAAGDAEDVVVASVDGEREAALSGRFGVEGYPSVLFVNKGWVEGGDVVEFGDYRWAEVMAEFVNNGTGSAVIDMAPRKSYLRWRKRVPWNRGSTKVRATGAAGKDITEEDVLEKVEGAEGMRDPEVLGSPERFENLVGKRKGNVLVHFFSKGDPFQRETMMQWRQASSAFAPSEDVTLAVMDVARPGNAALAARYGVDETPAAMFFGTCEEGKGADASKCDVPVECEDGCETTDDIIQFLSDRMMIQMGLSPEDAGRGESYEVTEEEYEKMKAEGKVFANEEDSQDQVRQAHEAAAAAAAAGATTSGKEDL